MQEDFEPKTELSGSLDPPSPKPPTAVATGSPGPEPEDRRVAVTRSVTTPNAFGRFLSRAFDVIDEAADKVAEALNIRPRSHT